MYKNLARRKTKKQKKAGELQKMKRKREGGNVVGVIQCFTLTVSFYSKLYQCLFLQNLQQ